MPTGTPVISDQEFIELYNAKGPRHIVRVTGLARRNVQQRRQRLARRLGVEIKSPNGDGYGTPRIPGPQGKHRIELNIKDGHVVVFSDAHYWPGQKTLMHRALVRMVKDLKPKVIIANGDVMDFPSISRHASIGWEKRPKVQEEIEFAQERLHEIALAAGRGVEKIWTLGNHDSRFETRIANLAPDYAKVHGVHLRDHFPDWEPAWSTFVNGSVLIKHRFKGGIHAVHNNLLWSGVHCVTGHLHSAQVRALTLYDERTIWGMDSGCLAEPTAAAFVNYTEDNPKNWRSAFGVLTFRDGKLMQPELVLKWDEKHIQFRGEIIKV